MSQDVHYRAFDKPAGVATHRTQNSNGPRRWGFVEYISWRTGHDWQVVHRLDKGTTGVILFAENLEANQVLSELFADEAHDKIQKVYLFVTDRELKNRAQSETAQVEKLNDGTLVIRSHIYKSANQFLSVKPSLRQQANAESEFELIQSAKNFHLWQARPRTGKPHQIRLHAKSVGIPILGDEEHGGTFFATLMLHATEISVADPRRGLQKMSAEPPILMQNLKLLENADLAAWLAACDRRKRLFSDLEKDQCLRLIHTEGGNLRADRFGEVLFFYWFGDLEPTAHLRKNLNQLAELCGIRKWFLRWMKKRGGGVHELPLWTSESELPLKWNACEGDLRFELRADAGLSPGLFLDQRMNRKWVREQARDLRVLNLFCYTGGFSLASALGGAGEVVSVDLSQSTLNWCRRNFELNGLKPSQYEFWKADARDFLRRTAKRGRQFDLIVCDPPSFARGESGVFRIEKDLPALLQELAAVLAANGRILLSSNYEKWREQDFHNRINKAVSALKLDVVAAPPSDWDYELPGVEPILKSLVLTSSSKQIESFRL